MGEKKFAYVVMARKSEAWVRGSDIEISLKETGWEGVDWTDPAQDREKRWAVVNMAVNIWSP